MGMPAAKRGDQVVATDTHIVMVPAPSGPPVPTPLPHPFVGVIDDAPLPDPYLDVSPENRPEYGNAIPGVVQQCTARGVGEARDCGSFAYSASL